MIRWWRRLLGTMQLVIYALIPAGAGGAAAASRDGETATLAPRQIRGGMGRYLDGRGELRLFFPDCLAPAAPFILFRLKREGFSGCLVRVSEQGLYVEGRR